MFFESLSSCFLTSLLVWSGGKVMEWYSLCKYITNWILISICLLIQRDVTRTTRNRPPVFVYLCKLLVVPCAVRLNIQYLFVYLFKSMSTKPHASDHLYLFIYADYLLSSCAFRLDIHIYLFTYSNQCQQKHTQRPPVFVYLCKLPVVSMCCSYEY